VRWSGAELEWDARRGEVDAGSDGSGRLGELARARHQSGSCTVPIFEA
jgi:hypothetical protein